MDVKALINSILKLAIEGGLVKQIESEGSAKDLIKEIKVVKEKLIKEKKLKKQKGLSEIEEDEIPFDIPSSWEWVKLGELGEVNPRNNLNDDENVNFVPMKLVDGGYRSCFEVEIKKWKEVKKNYRHFKCGDLIMAKITPCFENRKSALIINKELEFCSGSTEFHVLRPYHIKLREYVLLYLKSAYFLKYGSDNMSGTAGQKRVSTIIFKNALIPLPPIAEQKRIVTKIEELMPYVDEYDILHSKLELLNKKFPEELKKSILQYAIQGKLVEQRKEEGNAEELFKEIQKEKDRLIKGKMLKKEKALSIIGTDEIPFKIPNNWIWVRLGNITTIKGGKRVPAGEKLLEENTGKIYLRVADLKNGTVDPSCIKYIDCKLANRLSKYIISKDDLYITVAGTIGDVGIIPKEYDNANLTENADKIITYKNNKNFLMYVLTSNLIQNQIKNKITKVGQPKLAITRINDILIPVPPLKEQERIVAKIEELLNWCNLISK